MLVFFALRIVAQTHPEIEAWIPRWDRVLLFALVISWSGFIATAMRCRSATC
jgi:hypothetical protein